MTGRVERTEHPHTGRNGQSFHDADVLVENYSPRVTRRLGIDYATVREREEVVPIAHPRDGRSTESSDTGLPPRTSGPYALREGEGRPPRS